MKGIKKGLAILLVLCTLLSMVVMTGAGVTTDTKPADAQTTSQPFDSGTGGSANFRIPALVTLSDGTLVAAADARWDTTADGGGLDTIVSRSSNNGETWNYTFANYLGDNGNVHNKASTCFIDPALATDGSTVYMIVDLFPAGYALNGATQQPSAGDIGFTSDGYLKLSVNSSSSYDYYLKDGFIYDSNNIVVSGYTVDEYFNITGNGCNTNLFCADSPYQVYPTNYLYLTSSSDGGANWSKPTLINVKKATEQTCLIGPGAGIVTDNGTLIFAVYNYTSGYQRTSIIYSTDDGETWTRSADATSSDWSSEAAVVELADGTIRCFYRDGNSYLRYTDYTWQNGAYVPGTPVTTTATKTTNNQLSAIKYSSTINGKPAVLVSTANSGSATRSTGVIYTFLLDDNNNMELEYTYSVNGSSYYAYSCLTELDNGSIGLLYEDQVTESAASITYTNIPIANIATGATIGDSTEPATAEKDVTLYVGQTKTVTDESGNYESSYTGSGLNTDIANVEVAGTTTAGSTTTEFSMVTSPASGSSYYISDGEGNYLTLTYSKKQYSLTNTTNRDQATLWKAEESDGKWRFSAVANNQTRYINYSNNSINAGTTNSYVWFYDATGGIYGSIKTDNRLGFNYSNGSWTSVTTNSSYGNGAFYANQTITTPEVNKTDITITGAAVGTTSVVVGNTRYNITVKELPAVVDLESTPFIGGSNKVGTSDSNASGNGQKITKLTTSVGLSYDLDLNISGNSITWSSADTSVATVDQNGTITGVGVGETTVTATIDGVAYTIPVVVRNDATSNSTRIYDFYASEIKDTTVYYVWNCTTELNELQEGEAIYVSFDQNVNTCCDFFGAPAEGYALTRMSSTNSDGAYFLLHTGDHQTIDIGNTGFYNGTTEVNNETKSGAGKNQQSHFGTTNGRDNVLVMLDAVIAEGCDGGMGFTRLNTDSTNVTSTLTFRSQKLPTVEKTIKTVNGAAYTEGMTAKAGDVIVYDVTVTQYATTEAITYSSVTLTDNLSGAEFSTSNSNTVNPNLANSALTENQTYSYKVTYTIQDEDLDTDIINTVDLTYDYRAQYSSGSFGGSANAEAKISAPSFIPADIVIDFGLPVTIDYSGENAHGRYDLSRGNATYGDVTVENNVVTYTPNTVLKGVDTVTLTNIKGVEYTFNVYPATTVYYEEGFATPYPNDTYVTTEGESKDLTQQTSTVGSKARYGYDDVYNSVGDSNGTAMKLEAGKGAATFTFTGTGVDVYTRSTIATGSMMIRVVDADNNLVKVISVNTVMKNGETDATDAQEVTAYNVPVVSLSGLERGTYTLQIAAVKSGSAGVSNVYIDGFRVYGTLQDQANDVYKADQEDSPIFIELRDKVLASLNAEATDSEQYADQIAKNTLSQVYATAGTTEGVAITSKPGTYTDAALTDLLDKGPKNEIYLQPSQALTFKITTNRVVQIGLKALNAATNCMINGTAQDLNTSTDMFYTVLNKTESESEQTITITNNGAGILAITKLKVCDDPNATLGELTAEDLIPALVSLGYEAEPVEATATLNITVQAGGETLTTTLTATGTEGESHTFTAAEIQAAVEVLELPEGYTLDGVTFEDVTVTCGEASDASFTAAEIPAPTPVSPLQKIVQIAVKIIRKIVSWF